MGRDIVMDIDFDFCVLPTLTRGYSDRSRQPDTMRVWLSAESFVGWLKGHGLFFPGGFAGTFESHQCVLAVWSDLLVSGRLTKPFDLLHIDAHPDMMEIDGRVAARLEANSEAVEEFGSAKAGNFLQYAVRLGWIHHIWMMFPDDEYESIDALTTLGPVRASEIVRKRVESIAKASAGGVDLLVRIGNRLVDISLHTRMTLPQIGCPTVTVLAHSPEFVPVQADGEYLRLAEMLRGDPC